MRPVFALILFLVAGSLFAQREYNNGWGGVFRSKVKGNGELVKQERNIDDFTGVKACCSLNVELRQGSYSVEVEAESNLQEYIKVERRGRTLEIGFERNTNIKTTKPITVYVTLPDLEYVGASSSAKMTGKSSFRGDDLELDVSSSGAIYLDFSGDEIEADASSGGKIEVSGSVSFMDCDASSGSKIHAGDCKAKRARADVSSGAGVTVYASEEVDAEASSGGSVRYRGNPGAVDSDTSSGGSVRSGN
ncbi:head GIN domain-containing protein [Lewinella sp. W8]|uniref:head GIN domain-containing protein n=1 Tax=Lewinella sp. W8 TaxID=2528208 RepID=UPI0010675768|nr:head GIN domain-containing protein [Lewinella sp. W8]MTB49653.1 hypothetical protein [Lewinella sp. W8]